MRVEANTIKITLASPIDAEAIAELEKACIECPWSERQIAESIKDNGYTFFVAKYEDMLVGYIGCNWCLDEGNICNVAVSEKMRRNGIATLLINELCIEADNRGAGKLFLEVNENNVSAKSLYEKLGFVTLYRRPNYYGSDSALVMVKEIVD